MLWGELAECSHPYEGNAPVAKQQKSQEGRGSKEMNNNVVQSTKSIVKFGIVHGKKWVSKAFLTEATHVINTGRRREYVKSVM